MKASWMSYENWRHHSFGNVDNNEGEESHMFTRRQNWRQSTFSVQKKIGMFESNRLWNLHLIRGSPGLVDYPHCRRVGWVAVGTGRRFARYDFCLARYNFCLAYSVYLFKYTFRRCSRLIKRVFLCRHEFRETETWGLACQQSASLCRKMCT